MAKLKKELGALAVFSIAAGAMISSGLFVLPGIAFAKAGPAMIIAYAFAAILMIPALLAKAELATAMPKSGGSYFFVERSLGPLVGTIAGFSLWLSISLKTAFAMIGIGALSALFLPSSNPWTIKIIACIACIVFMTINLISVKHAGKFQIVLVIALLAILLVYAAKAMPLIDGNRFIPFIPNGMGSVFAVTGMVFVSFGGLTKVVDIAEEVRDSKKNLPLGMFTAFIVVSLLYVLITFVTVGIVDRHKTRTGDPPHHNTRRKQVPDTPGPMQRRSHLLGAKRTGQNSVHTIRLTGRKKLSPPHTNVDRPRSKRKRLRTKMDTRKK